MKEITVAVVLTVSQQAAAQTDETEVHICPVLSSTFERYLSKERHQGAAEFVSRHLKQTVLPDGCTRVELFTLRARIYEWLGRNDEALTDLDNAVKSDSKSAWARQRRCFLLVKLRKFGSARLDCQIALELANGDAIDEAAAANSLASVFLGMRDEYAALRSWQMGLDALRREADLGNASDARVEYANQLEFVIRRRRSKLLLVTKQYDDALEDLSITARSSPIDAELQNEFCWALANSRQYEASLETCANAVALSPEAVHILDSYGFALIRNDKLEEAVTVLERALRIDSRHGWALYHIGIAYEMLGDKESASNVRTRLQEVLLDWPDVAALVNQ